jgi:hypothetical protein
MKPYSILELPLQPQSIFVAATSIQPAEYEEKHDAAAD